MFWRFLIFAFLAVGALAEKSVILKKKEIRDYVEHVAPPFCKKAGTVDVEDTVKQITNSAESFLNCVNLLVDFHTLTSEIEAAKPNGALGEVFKKYCAKTPELKTCFHTLIDAASPCMESAERELPLSKTRTDHIIDYVCYNDGNRITQFVTDNGTECIINCEFNKCKPHFDKPDKPFDSFMSLTATEKCRLLDELTTCFLRPLKTCTPPTPGYLLESLIGYMRKESVCNDVLPLPATTETTTWPTATRMSSPTGMRTISPPATRTTSPTATKTISPMFELTVSLTGTLRVALP